MRKLLAALAFLVVSACADQTALDRATVLEQAYTTAETAFIVYLNLPDCDSHPQPCSDDAVVARVQPIDNSAFNAVQAYRDAVVLNKPDSVLQELLVAAQAALSALAAAAATLHQEAIPCPQF